MDRRLGISGHQHQVGAGFQGQHRRLSGAVMAADRLHDEGIGHHQAVEAQVVAQQVGEHGL